MLLQQLNQYVNIFTNSDWDALENIIDHISLHSPELIERPSIGDSRSEPVNLEVIRIMVRKNSCSQRVNEPYCFEVMNILERANFLSFIIKYTGISNLQILRMQFNLMKTGSFVGLHTDKESDPAYLATAVIRTNSHFSDGELVLHGTNKRIVSQRNRTVFLMDSSIAHEVLPVTKGYRNSLIIVLGKMPLEA